MTNIHAERAKRWNVTPYQAEWFANAIEYCQNTTEGKRGVRDWITRKLGPEGARETLALCARPPDRYYGPASSFGLGSTNCDALKLYYSFVSSQNLCAPERSKPAPKRRRGESSTAWLAVNSLLNGCKFPNLDWGSARAIAISEFDKARDTMDLMRASPDRFVDSIIRRARSTILSPREFPENDIVTKVICLTYTASLEISHMAWKHAAELFEDLANMGLTTASAIEREYKRDTAFMWRLVMCFAKIDMLARILWYRMVQVVSDSQHFRPYFKRLRTSEGVAHVLPDKSYIGRHGYETPLDELVVGAFCEGRDISEFYASLSTLLEEDRTRADVFDADAYDEMGDLATVAEFIVNIRDSPFGQALRLHMKSLLADDPTQQLEPYKFIAGVDPSKLTLTESPESGYWGLPFSIVWATGTAWLHVTGTMNVGALMEKLLYDFGDPNSLSLVPFSLKQLWASIDKHLWETSQTLDIPGHAGSVAKEFGVFDPAEMKRPTWLDGTLILPPDYGVSKGESEPQPRTTPAPAPVVHVPPVASADAAVASGRAYVRDMKTREPKSKTRGAREEPPKDNGDVSDEDRLEDFPLELPPGFKLGRKVVKIFEQILAPAPDALAEDHAPRKGQIRWGDFEKAMRRIGFAVVQTTGSSVRFDPPAQTARPISLHRPHPESILTPVLIKW
ncbi:hypothetical protein OE88DRAFT_1626999 [Heliocybe sulcata]|uniref:Uncharacterized protein n=1 Tax=Heliocybe sulcata TaxID=5364 RepID=A0A5C3N712_9AGAM|nr:hypothetical protein OE88DRAFT_1626999 [Heliocybe sulcata]